METKITEHYFKFGTVKYFRGKAENVELGSYGEKKDPIGAIAYLQVQNKVKPEYVDSHVKFITTTEIDWENATKADVEANGDVKVYGLNVKPAASFSYEKVKSAKLKLTKLAIDEGPLKTMLNKDADIARNYLAGEGGDGRIVSEIWIAMDAQLSEHFSTSGSFSASVGAGGQSVDFTASGGKHGSQTVTLSKGTTFAYMLHKVKDWNKDKTQIEDLENDLKGLQ